MDFECVIVGGGAAGLSAALTLGRARRRTLLLDVGGQSNRATAHAQGLLGHDGIAPSELYARGREQLGPYDAVTVEDVAASGARTAEDGGFEVALEDGREVTSTTLLLATGMDYELPGVPGFAEGWGEAVFHCPFCHGWEVRDRKLAVYALGEAAQHLEPLLRGWSDDVTVLDPRQVARLRYDDDGTLLAAVHKDGTEVACDAVLTHTPLRRRGTWAEDLGLELTELGMVEADAFGATSVPGVFAAGDLAVMPSLPQAVTTGQMAGVGIVRRLLVDHA